MIPRRLSVPANRLATWLAGFERRHGSVEVDVATEVVTVRAADGAVARCDVPFAPLAIDPHLPYAGLLAHVVRDRRVGVVLVRRGGYATGVFDGERLDISKVGSRHVQGRTAAGGQSQRRFARRREKQTREAFEAAADVVVQVLLPHAESLEAVVTGGDRAAVDHVLADRRLMPIRALVVPRHLPVPDPRLVVLKSTPTQFRAVWITLDEPESPSRNP